MPVGKERQTGNADAPIRFAGARLPDRDRKVHRLAFAMLLLTAYMPMLVMVHGKVTRGQIIIRLLSSVRWRCSTFASALTASQPIAILGGAGSRCPAGWCVQHRPPSPTLFSEILPWLM